MDLITTENIYMLASRRWIASFPNFQKEIRNDARNSDTTTG